MQSISNMFNVKCFCLILFLQELRVRTSTNVPVIELEYGILKGTTGLSRNGTLFNAFYGIPFAEPPVGKLRFQPPVEAKPWTGVFNATDAPSMCVQIIENTNDSQGSEDCLNLNVFTPLSAKAGSNIPVIFYIFGGDFVKNSNLVNGPEYMMNNDIVIVMPNYRLGVLGFISTGDDVIPGNMGLKDQVLALKWTKKNIYHFGGDPNRITLHGHSSGAVSAHLHTLSPLSKGLFDRVIIQSGPAIPIGYFDRQVARNAAKEVAKRLGCVTNSSNDILDCLISMDAFVFPPLQQQLPIWHDDPDFPMRPTVENKSTDNAFLIEVPVKAPFQATDLNWMIGITTGECAFKVAGYLINNEEEAKDLDANYKILFPITLQYLWSSKTKYLNFISESVRLHYLGEKNIDNETAIPLMNMFTDALFGRGTNDVIRKYEGTRFVYLYDYYSNYSTQNKRGSYRRLGVSHAEELHLIYRHSSSVNSLSWLDIAFGDELITRLINFAYSGNPNRPFFINESLFSKWDPVTTNRIEYLRIKLNGSMETDYCENSYKFWKNLPVNSKYS